MPLILALLAGCAKPGLRGVKPWVSEVEEADRSIDRHRLNPSRNLPQIEWKPTLDRVSRRLTPAARSTCLAVSASNCDKTGNPVGIVNDPTINAFVDKQHHITVHAGLLAQAASDEEIAAVLAHEYGHIFARHIEKQQQNAALGLLAGGVGALVLAGTTGIDVTREAMELGYGAGAFVYSQASELEADYYAALILENSGIDLKHGQDVLIRLARSSAGNTRTWSEKAQLMAATHPANNFRIARWLGLSRSIEDSKRLGGKSQNHDNQLRQDAWSRLLGSLHGGPVRWVNPQNGRSGTLWFKKAKYDKKCKRSCIQIEQVDHVQEKQMTSWHWMCKTKGGWVPKDSTGCAEGGR